MTKFKPKFDQYIYIIYYLLKIKLAVFINGKLGVCCEKYSLLLIN
jgi:hypothetical protein